jgi:hypothetical protein
VIAFFFGLTAPTWDIFIPEKSFGKDSKANITECETLGRSVRYGFGLIDGRPEGRVGDCSEGYEVAFDFECGVMLQWKIISSREEKRQNDDTCFFRFADPTNVLYECNSRGKTSEFVGLHKHPDVRYRSVFVTQARCA